MKTVLLTIAALALGSSLAMAQDICAPAKVTDLATTQYYGSISLSWTATGDDCTTGNATSYEVRYSTSAITATNWCSLPVLTGDSVTNGNQETACLTVTPCATTTYYFAVFLIDDAGNRSPISNGASGAARCSAPFETCP